MKRRLVFGVAIGVGLVLGLFLGSIVVSAQTEVPDGVQVFEISTGHVCVVWPDGSGGCYCPCTGVGPDCTSPNVGPRPTPTDGPGPDPTTTPTPAPTDEPDAKCNRGIGNDAEGCDPGNSYGQGKGDGRRAGEDRDE